MLDGTSLGEACDPKEEDCKEGIRVLALLCFIYKDSFTFALDIIRFINTTRTKVRYSILRNMQCNVFFLYLVELFLILIFLLWCQRLLYMR